MLDDGILGEITLDEIDVLDEIHRQDVGGQHAALRRAGVRQAALRLARRVKSYKPSLAWNYWFWLGTISAALLLLVTLSGLPLLLLYVPSVERAYGSVNDIEYVITFGSWLRSAHRLSAHLMVGVVFLHLARVFLTGAYKNGAGRAQNRQWNWVIGVAPRWRSRTICR